MKLFLMGVVCLDETVKNSLVSLFWGFILALISTPFYLAVIGIPEIGKKMGLDSFLLFMVPLSAAFLVAVVLSDKDMKFSVMSIISGMAILTFFIIIFMIYPFLKGVVVLNDYYYISLIKKLLLSALIMFPSFFIGAFVGKIFGERYISEESKKEREELNKIMREWREALDIMVEEKDKKSS